MDKREQNNRNARKILMEFFQRRSTRTKTDKKNHQGEEPTSTTSLPSYQGNPQTEKSPSTTQQVHPEPQVPAQAATNFIIDANYMDNLFAQVDALPSREEPPHNMEKQKERTEETPNIPNKDPNQLNATTNLGKGAEVHINTTNNTMRGTTKEQRTPPSIPILKRRPNINLAPTPSPEPLQQSRVAERRSNIEEPKDVDLELEEEIDGIIRSMEDPSSAEGRQTQDKSPTHNLHPRSQQFEMEQDPPSTPRNTFLSKRKEAPTLSTNEQSK